MERSKSLTESRIGVLTSSLKSAMSRRFGGANKMAVAPENSLMPRALAKDISQTRQPSATVCAAHEHPLFVSGVELEDVSDDHVTENIKVSQPESLAFTSESASVDASKANDGPDNSECRWPPDDDRKHQDDRSCSSIRDSDSEGQRLSSSPEDGLRRDIPSYNAPLGSSLSSNGLESSVEEFCSVLTDMPPIPQNNSMKQAPSKADIPATIASGQTACKSDLAAEPTVGNAGIRVPQRTEGQRSKALSPPSESAKKSKVKPENSGNNLVFTYKKDAEEIEIKEQASEDSHSSSDLDVEPVDRGTEIHNNLNESANSNLHARNRNCSATSEEHKKPLRKKKTSFGFVLNPNYKFRHDEFKRIFRNVPRSDRLIVDYSCALQKNILVQGRLYISYNWICFYACIFGVETTVSIPLMDITQITKEKTALVFPNAIQISTKDEKHFFGSLNARDKTYLIISYFWKNANSQQPMSAAEMWSWIHYSYGEDLGVDLEDQDYIAVSPEEKAKHMAKIELEATTYQDLEGVGTSDFKDMAGDDDTLTAGSEGICKNPVTKFFGPGLVAPEPNDSSGEIHCSGHDHFPINVCDEVINFSVDKLFEQCFSNSQVFRRFTEIKKTTEFVTSEWPKTPTANGEFIRNLTYTLSLNLAMTSKKAPATEKQVMYPSSKPGQNYFIDSECRTPTIPYGDSFYVVNRYCLTRVTETKSRLRITSQIVYQKSVFFKSFIEKNATSGILETFKIFVTLLQKESEGKGDAEHDLLSTNPSTLTPEQLVSNVELGKSAQLWEFCAKTLISSWRLLLLVLVLVVMMMMLIKFVLHSDGSEMNVCDMEQKTTYDLIHQLKMQLYQQHVEIEKWKTEHTRMMQTIDDLQDKIAYLLQQKHP